MKYNFKAGNAKQQTHYFTAILTKYTLSYVSAAQKKACSSTPLPAIHIGLLPILSKTSYII